jgi:hypothetical protein
LDVFEEGFFLLNKSYPCRCIIRVSRAPRLVTQNTQIISIYTVPTTTTAYKRAATPIIPMTTPVRPPADTESAAPVN